MISVDNAIEIIQQSTPILQKKEIVSLFDCMGRILFEDIVAGFNVPLKNNSSMDGYAVISEDIQSASKENPVVLEIHSEIRAGGSEEGITLKRGNAIRIMTGAPVPSGADTVIPFEDIVQNGNSVTIKSFLNKFENIRFSGEDIKKGETVLKRGMRIDSAEAGLLASLNFYEIPVFKKPEIGILSTGDELIEPGKSNSNSNIYNSNAYLLFSEIKKYGGNPHYEGIVKDDYSALKNKISEMLKYDVVITTGGVSMGRYDFIPDVIRELGIELRIQKVLIKPGKPIVFGIIGEKIFFGLPGNPVSTMVSFLKFVRPAILKMSGSHRNHKPVVKAILTKDMKNKSGRAFYARGIFTIKDGRFYAETTGSQSSGILSSMSRGNCLIALSENIDYVKAGDTVDIELINHGEI